METLDAQYAYLVGEGYSGALEDMLLAYYNVQNSATDTALYDAQYKFMIGLGLSGSLEDMLYSNDSTFGTVSSDYLLLEDGDSILLESGDILLKE